MKLLINSYGLRFAIAATTVVWLAGVSWGQLTPPQPGGAPAGATPAEGTQEQVDTGKMQQDADRAMDEGRFEEALAIYSQLGQIVDANMLQLQERYYPFKATVHTGRGRALAGMQEYEAALEEFKEAIEAAPDFPPALLARGEMWLDLKAASQAFPDFQMALKADRSNVRILFGLGKSLVLGGQWEPAIKPLTRVLETQGEAAEAFRNTGNRRAEAHRLRGIAYAGMYKYETGLEDIRKSIELNPDDHESYFELAGVYLRMEDYAQAIDALAQSIAKYKPPVGREEEPYSLGHSIKAAAHIELGKKLTDEDARRAAYQAAIDEAGMLLAQLDERNPSLAQSRASALYSRGVGERMLGQFGQAIRTFSLALELNPALGEAYFRRGICLHYVGEDKMALADFQQAAVINFNDPRANLWEGFIYASLGNYHEAVRAYGDAIAASDRYTPAYVNRGLAYMMLGEPEKAISDLDYAIRIEPMKSDYYFKRGVAYEQLGDLAKARDSFRSAIEFDPRMAVAYRRMADIVQSQGHGELAEQYRRKASELDAPQPQ